ncbi:MAG TPA: VOC family protein [Solirubrobacteraceae bacterium]|nr:VOC family protein [Solirubrobacteraceae bacterium]
MKLEGIHHVTAITADAQANVDFYAGVLGLRLVKKSVNQDDTSVYHLFYADETGDPGSDITFFEYPGVPRGRPGAGMIHRVVWRLRDPKALDFWEERLSSRGCDVARHDDSVVFDDPEGLTHELRVVEMTDEPLIAADPEIPPELAIQGFHAVRAYAVDPERSRALLEDTIGFVPVPHGPAQTGAYELRGDHRGGFYLYDPPPAERGVQGAGSVHHVAWASQPEDQEAWHDRLVEQGVRATPIIDRHYFRSIYFREPSGVLFEIATIGPGFTVDEPLDSLGEKLSLTPQYEHLRDEIEPTLTPLTNPRDAWARK